MEARAAMIRRAKALSLEASSARPTVALVLHAQALGLLMAVAIMDGRLTSTGRWIGG